MKKKLFALLVVALCAMSCQNGIWDAIHDLEDKYTDLDGRVAKLEELCKEMNTNISSLQTLVSVILTNDYIISVTPITKDGKEIGYTITFAIHEPITIYHGENGKDGPNGKDGKDGENGKDGLNGQDGQNGADGITPIIGVAQDETDHAYYWTLNGEWLLDANGNRIPLSSRDGVNGQDGKDGKDGQDGTNGQDGITPRLKIENDYWYISYDNGVTWTQLGKAVGENGQDGRDGIDGQDGEKGEKGDQGEPGYSMFTEVTQDDDFVYFTLSNGTILTVRKGNSTFDQTIIDNLVTSLTLDQIEVWMSAIGEQVQITATTTPFPNSKVYWESSDSTIVSVVDGVLSSHATGRTSITATAGDKSAKVSVHVGIGDFKTFSVSATKQVYFASGDLEYSPISSHSCADGTIKKGIWHFADKQYEQLNYSYFKDKDTTKACDLFFLGQSGYKFPVTTHNPVNFFNNAAQADWDIRHSMENTNYDWGMYNAINSNNSVWAPGAYRVLTKEEWTYLLAERENASYLQSTISIDGVSYLVIFPDFWKYDNVSFPNKVYTNKEPFWSSLVNKGAVAFLYNQPYWTMSFAMYNDDSGNKKCSFYILQNGTITSTSAYSINYYSRQAYGLQGRVRLVKDVE